MFRKDSATESGWEAASADAAVPSCTHKWNTQKLAGLLKPRGGHHACVHVVVCGMKLADPGITTEPRGLTASHVRRADFFTTAVVTGRSVALDVCVASSTAAAARGDAAQAAFDRKLSQLQESNRRTEATGCSAPSSCVDGGRATAPSRHSNASAHGRNCLQPERAAFVGKIKKSQVETRNPNRSPASEGSHGTRCGQSGSSQASLTEPLHHCGHVPRSRRRAPATTTSTTLRLTQQHKTTIDIVFLASYTYESVQPSSL